MPSVLTFCPLCQAKASQHPKCARCTVLIGPGHEEDEGRWIDGRLLCSDCQRRIALRPAPFREALKSQDGLFEYWRAGADRVDVEQSRLVMAGTMKVRRKRRV